MTGESHLWPMAELIARLQADDLLRTLCDQRQVNSEKFDTREHLLEDLIGQLVRERHLDGQVTERQEAGRTFEIPKRHFLARSRPDLVLALDDQLHVLEVKSSKVGDNRSQCVLGKPFQKYLGDQGYNGPPPREVEQDLIKMALLIAIDARIASASLLMIDGYAGNGLKWSRVFADADLFARTMRTPWIQKAAEKLVASTEIRRMSVGSMVADVILCQVVNPDRTEPL